MGPMTPAASTPAIRCIAGHGLQLGYREWNGAAPGLPLLLLHGVTGSSVDWTATVAAMPARRIMALDARGHGASDWDPDEANAGDQHFADIAVALDELDIERCHLAGFSMGGGVAMIAGAALPERVATVTAVDSYPQPTMTPGSRRIASWVSGYASNGAWFDPAIARKFADQLAAGNEERLDLWSMWEAIESPALVVRGELSDVLPAAVADEMLARQPRAQLHSVKGVAHGIPYVRPAELAAVLERFTSAAEHA